MLETFSTEDCNFMCYKSKQEELQILAKSESPVNYRLIMSLYFSQKEKIGNSMVMVKDVLVDKDFSSCCG